MSARQAQPLTDLSLIVGGQGGDGSLTLATLFADLLRARGFHIYSEREVLSQIKGGPALAAVRVSRQARYVIGDTVGLLVGFDEASVRHAASRLAPQAAVIYDDSDGALPDGILAPDTRLHAAPFGRAAVRRLGRTLYKNSIAAGFTARVLGVDDEEMRRAFTERFSGPRRALRDDNLVALAMGFGLAEEQGFAAGQGLYRIGRRSANGWLQLSGNEAVAFGFLVAGGRFFAGYPITPATEIMTTLAEWLPRFGGVVEQAEDELAAVNLAIGAALVGARAMVATSGPGLALMQEGIGQAGSAEIPLVIVDAQRSGPSTGMPTKSEQSDLNLMVFGANGEFPRVVLAPSHPEDCFSLTVDACNLAERYQCPVYLGLDQAIAQNSAGVAPFNLDAVQVDRGKRLSAEELAALETYQRYALTDDGVSPHAVPATPGGIGLVTGNERDPFGFVSADPLNRKRMVEKRARKLERACAEGQLPGARRWGDADAAIGLIGIGAAFGATVEAMEQLEARSLPTQLLTPRTIWPVLPETLDFVRQRRRVYVVEQNATGQLAKLLIREGACAERLRSVLRYDGRPLRPGDLAAEIAAREERA